MFQSKQPNQRMVIVYSLEMDERTFCQNQQNILLTC